jgi:hypothetical protein
MPSAIGKTALLAKQPTRLATGVRQPLTPAMHGHGIPGERSNNGVGSGGQDNSSAKNGESREHHSRPGAAGERASCRCVRHPYGGLPHEASSKATAISNVILAISTWPKRAMVNSICSLVSICLIRGSGYGAQSGNAALINRCPSVTPPLVKR